jgi:hypothetical protein
MTCLVCGGAWRGERERDEADGDYELFRGFDDCGVGSVGDLIRNEADRVCG